MKYVYLVLLFQFTSGSKKTSPQNLLDLPELKDKFLFPFLRKAIAGDQGSEIWLSCLGPTVPKHSRKSSHSRTKNYSGPRSSEKTHKTNIFIEKKKKLQKKTNLATMASGEVKMVAKHYTPLQYFWACYEKNAAWTKVSHMFRNVFLVHLKVTFGHFVQLVAPTDQWLATMFKITIVNSGEFQEKCKNLATNFKISIFLCF